MQQALRNNIFLVKEHIGLFKAASNYDIFDPNTGRKIMECREPNLGIFTKIFRFTDYKRMTPFSIEIKTSEGEKVLSVKRGISLFLSKVTVLDENDQVVGYFKQKLFSIGGKFDVLNAQEEAICTLKGKWTGWNFKFINGTTELGGVSKKWAGIGKELLTTADNYVISIGSQVKPEDPARILMLAAVMCIDMVLKE